MRRFSVPLSAALLTAALVTSGCATPAAPVPDATATASDHGRVAGAAEVSEPQLALTTIAPGGAVAQLDLLDDSWRELEAVPGVVRASTDGRYVFADTGEGVRILDSGVWTWDHVDHFHYYRAEPRTVGTVEGDGIARVATTNSSTTGGTGVFFAGSGEAVLLDTAALSEGEVRESFRLEVGAHDGLVVPFGSFALVSDPAGSLRVHTAEGEPVDGGEIACPAAAGTATTRVGAVVGCADGAVLARVENERALLEKIPYPEGATAPAATAFEGREGRPTVAGLAGDEGVWMLDTREKRFALLAAPTPLVRVSTVDDADENVLALAADGRVLVLDGVSGALRATTESLLPQTILDVDALAGVSLIVDQQRAYLNAPLEHRLYEIDFADAARIARTFDTADAPAFVAGVGR